MAKQSSDKDQPFNFEQALSELEKLVEKLEQGELPLEQALEQFEQGVKLTRRCQTALKEAEHKVEVLLQEAGEPPQIKDFEE